LSKIKIELLKIDISQCSMYKVKMFLQQKKNFTIAAHNCAQKNPGKLI